LAPFFGGSFFQSDEDETEWRLGGALAGISARLEQPLAVTAACGPAAGGQDRPARHLLQDAVSAAATAESSTHRQRLALDADLRALPQSAGPVHLALDLRTS